MDKKEFIKVVNKVFINYGFKKIKNKFFLDLDDVLICSKVSGTPYGETYLGFVFKIKILHQDEGEEKEFESMDYYEDFDSLETHCLIENYTEGRKINIKFEPMTEEICFDELTKLVHRYFDPFRENAMKHIERGYSEIRYLDGNEKFVLHVDKVRALGFKIYEAPKIDIWELWK